MARRGLNQQELAWLKQTAPAIWVYAPLPESEKLSFKKIKQTKSLDECLAEIEKFKKI